MYFVYIFDSSLNSPKWTLVGTFERLDHAQRFYESTVGTGYTCSLEDSVGAILVHHHNN